MKHSSVKNLMIVTALSASFAVFLSFTKVSNDQPLDDTLGSQPFLAGLEDSKQNITAISLTKGDDNLLLNKDNGQWQIASHHQYPANAEVIEDFLRKLENTKKLKARSNKPGLYHRMNLDENATKVVLSNDQGDSLFSFDLGKVGKPLEDRASRFARLSSEAQAWLINEPEVPDLSLMSWVDDTILTLDSSRVWKVDSAPVDGQSFQIINSDLGFNITNLAEDEEIADAYKLDALANSLNSVRFDDVRPSDGSASFDKKLTVHTYDGLMITAQIDFSEDGAWLQLSAAAGEPATADEMPETISGVPENLTNAVALYNNRFEGWLFRLPSYAQADVQTNRADLVKLTTPTEPEEGENPQ